LRAAVKTFQEVWVWELDKSSGEWCMNQRESSRAAAQQMNEWVRDSGAFILGIDIGPVFQGDEARRQLHTTYAVRYMSVEDYIGLEATIRKHAAAASVADIAVDGCRLRECGVDDPLMPR